MHYYYTKDINDYLSKNKSPNMLKIKDNEQYHAYHETLKQFYTLEEGFFVMMEIIEYYKYHSEIPRLFMHPMSKLLNCFFNNKRRIKFRELMCLLDVSETENG